MSARGRQDPALFQGLCSARSPYQLRPLLLLFLHRLRSDPLDGYASQFHRVHRLIAADRSAIDFRHYILPLHHRAEDSVLAVPYAHGTGGDEKLAATRIGLAGVCHGELARAVEPQTGQKLVANGEAAVVRAGSSRVARLDHLARHHAVERNVVVQRQLRHRPGLGIAGRLGALCQGYKILHRNRRIFLVKPGGDISHRRVEDGIESVGLWLRRKASCRKKEEGESGHGLHSIAGSTPGWRGWRRDTEVNECEAPIGAATGVLFGSGAFAGHALSHRSLTVAALNGVRCTPGYRGKSSLPGRP